MSSIKFKKLSNVQLAYAVEGISRKLALRRETCIEKKLDVGGNGFHKITIPGHTYMGISSNVVNVHGYGQVRKNRLFIRKSMVAPVSTTEQLDNRAYFTQANAWVVAAQKDLMAITTNQQRFYAAAADLNKKIEGVSLEGYQKMRGWMCAIAFRLLANGKTLPQDHILPNFDA